MLWTQSDLCSGTDSAVSFSGSGAALVKKEGQIGMAVQAESVVRTVLATCLFTVTKYPAEATEGRLFELIV